MSVEKMFSRLRSMSGSKLKKLPGPAQNVGSTHANAPTKEDILNTLDGFGEKIQDPISENNNNTQNNLRHNNGASVVTEGQVDTTHADTEPTITSITHSYSLEWEKLFTKVGYLRHLRNYAMKGNLRSSRFRSVAWKLFLEVLPEDSSLWAASTKLSRNKYKDLKDKLIVNPRNSMDTQDLTFNNPLSQETESPWNRFFLDNELRLTIKQDVIRTFPEIQFYHTDEVCDMMLNVLFYYCREHAAVSYRQGMHELLAPMIFVLHCDHQAFLHASELESLDEKIKYVLDPKYLEHDAYAMFSQVMLTMESWYVSKEVYPIKCTDMTSSQPFSKPQDLNPSNVIVTKLTRIQDYLLKKADLELHMHLERHDITPQIYGMYNVCLYFDISRVCDLAAEVTSLPITGHMRQKLKCSQICLQAIKHHRWIRLLFGREFPMQDLLVLWDAIFADGIGFDLVDYVFVAMLLYLRDHLLSSDYPSCLITLMRYPPVGDIQFFIEKARHLRDPHQFPRPVNYTYQSAQTAERTKEQNEPIIPKASTTSNTITTGHALSRKMFLSSRPKSLAVTGRHKMSKSSSEPMNLQTDISPVSPTPGNVPQHKRGSSASLSQVEDSMFRSVPSDNSLVHPETQSERSAISTPDDVVNHSPAKHATLSGRAKPRVKKSVIPIETESEIASLRGQLNEKDLMCAYCANKLGHHVERLQEELLHQSLQNEDEILLAIAGIKQVRDVLTGTLRFAQNLMEDDDISMNFNHYKMDIGEVSPENANVWQKQAGSEMSKVPDKRLFYMSSEENSEAMDSPTDQANIGGDNQNSSYRLPVAHDFEMEELQMANSSEQTKNTYKKMSKSMGPNDYDSDGLTSWSQSSLVVEECLETDSEASPNPLYRMQHSSYYL